jgi:hypothetical protein
LEPELQLSVAEITNIRGTREIIAEATALLRMNIRRVI